MEKCANESRRDDCSRLRHHALMYIPNLTVPLSLPKTERGWYNEHTARMLCPQNMLTAFAGDWQG